MVDFRAFGIAGKSARVLIGRLNKETENERDCSHSAT